MFDEYNHLTQMGIGDKMTAEQEEKATQRFRQNCLHLFSLLHALCIQHLRTDWDLTNLRPHLPTDPAPPLVRFLWLYFGYPPSAGFSQHLCRTIKASQPAKSARTFPLIGGNRQAVTIARTSAQPGSLWANKDAFGARMVRGQL